MNEPSAPVAVITGGSHGAGRAIAFALARQGYDLVLLHSKGGVDAAQATLDALRALRPESERMPVDVADESQVAEAFSHVLLAHGRLDVVVHGAGFLRLTPVAELDLHHLDTIIGTVVRGAFLVAREAVRMMGPGGSIVLISSVAVELGIAGSAPYAAAKAAVESLAGVLAEEVLDRGISVYSVALGPTEAEAPLLGNIGQVSDEAIGEFVSGLVDRRECPTTGQVIRRLTD